MTEASTQRVAVVTGAARGIGAAVATRLAQDGFAVAVLDLDESACAGTVDAITAKGGRALAVGVDVADAGAVATAVERVAAEPGAPAAEIPVQRVGRPDDIAATVSFLVSEEAGFVSGQVIYVAGGPRD